MGRRSLSFNEMKARMEDQLQAGSEGLSMAQWEAGWGRDAYSVEVPDKEEEPEDEDVYYEPYVVSSGPVDTAPFWMMVAIGVGTIALYALAGMLNRRVLTA